MATIRFEQKSDATPIATDILPFVQDPAGTHLVKSSTFAHIATLMASLLPPLGIISGVTPTINYIPKFTPGTTSIGNSLLFDNGTAIGLGHATPTARLDIKGLTANDLPTYSAEFLDASNWTSADWTGNWATGWIHAAGPTTALSHDHAAVATTKYQIAYTVTRSAGSFTIDFGGQSLAAITASGTWGPTATSTAALTITPTTDFVGTVIISIKSLTAVSTPSLILRNSAGTIVFEARSGNLNTNLIIGATTGRYNTTGNNNTFLGFGSALANTTGSQNIVIGTSAFVANTTGSYNTAIGNGSLLSNITGSLNTCLGNSALLNLVSGSNNVAFGYTAGRTLTSGSSNTMLGNAAGYHASQKVDAVNSMALGNGAYTTADNQVVIGNDSITSTILKGAISILANNIVTDTTTGMKIGTATNQKVGFFNKTPIVQQAHIADATGAADVITRCNAILAVLENFGFLATS